MDPQINLKFIDNEKEWIRYTKESLKKRDNRGGRSNSAAMRYALREIYIKLKKEDERS